MDVYSPPPKDEQQEAELEGASQPRVWPYLLVALVTYGGCIGYLASLGDLEGSHWGFGGVALLAAIAIGKAPPPKTHKSRFGRGLVIFCIIVVFTFQFWTGRIDNLGWSLIFAVIAVFSVLAAVLDGRVEKASADDWWRAPDEERDQSSDDESE